MQHLDGLTKQIHWYVQYMYSYRECQQQFKALLFTLIHPFSQLQACHYERFYCEWLFEKLLFVVVIIFVKSKLLSSFTKWMSPLGPLRARLIAAMIRSVLSTWATWALLETCHQPAPLLSWAAALPFTCEEELLGVMNWRWTRAQLRPHTRACTHTSTHTDTRTQAVTEGHRPQAREET